LHVEVRSVRDTWNAWSVEGGEIEVDVNASEEPDLASDLVADWNLCIGVDRDMSGVKKRENIVSGIRDVLGCLEGHDDKLIEVDIQKIADLHEHIFQRLEFDSSMFRDQPSLAIVLNSDI
jgi:hypothetical protein